MAKYGITNIINGLGNGQSDDCTVTSSYVLSGKTYIGADTNDDVGTGTMKNITNDATVKYSNTNNIKVVRADTYYLQTNSDDVRRLCLRYNNNSGYITKNTLFAFPVVTKTVTPSIDQQIINPDSNAVLEKVIVNAIPNQRSYAEGGFGEGTDYYAINALPEGYYRKFSDNDYEPEAHISKTLLRSKLGITADKFLKTKTIAGITGSIPDNTTRTSNGNVSGINSSYQNVPVRAGSSPQIQTNTDNVRRFCICPPTGYYQGGGNSYISCTLSELLNLIKIKQLTCIAYHTSSGDNKSEELSFTLESDGMVYYNGISATLNNSGIIKCEIYKNNVLVENRNIDSGSNYFIRNTMVNKSFSVKKGDIIRIYASASGGTFSLSYIDATILYF